MALIIGLLSQGSFGSEKTEPILVEHGQQPVADVDAAGVIRVVYGKDNSIFCSTSLDNGATFSGPVRVGTLSGMHLGMTRGPQIASSRNFSVITAMDKEGDIHAYQLGHKEDRWEKVALVNDQKGSAPEGLMSLAADREDHFYAVWLDTRTDRKNKIYFARSVNGGTGWEDNELVYKSPDQTVCECCRPSIAVEDQGEVVIMFRNWLDGARDMFFSASDDHGKTFSAARKMGEGTWKLKACPMDGGGVVVDGNKVASVWQREGHIYYAEPLQAEQEVGQGSKCAIASGENKTVVAWQNKNNIYIRSLPEGQKKVAGQGSFPRLASLKDGKVLCVWEHEGQVYAIAI